MAQDRSQLPAAQPELSSPNPLGKSDRAWTWGLSAALVVLAAVFFALTPPGLWNKLLAVGSAVCHQDPAHSFYVFGRQMPLCARCTGMYLGALLSLALHFRQGKLGGIPPRKVLIPLGLLFLLFALDGLNSLASSLGTSWNFYQTTNLTRLVTGTGAGLVIGAVLAPLFNQTAWAGWVKASALPNGKKLAVLLAAAAVIILVVYAGPQALRYPAAILSVLGVLVVLCLAYTTLALIILKRENIANSLRDLLLPLLVGLLAGSLQVAVFTFLRVWAF
ncbi:MAG TPA: hypothetical protein DCG78_02020 [Anaerolineaceae bacterium]|nr:hypothetical protein [Anaerolineaceae bacterium]